MRQQIQQAALALLAALFMSASSVFAQTDDPRQIVEGFLAAWDNKETETMYSYLSVRSKETYPQELFENRYQLANDEIGLTGLEYTIQDVKFQGDSALVTYDVVLESTSFGQIEDKGRKIRLVRIDGRWGIAWSTMDIFDVLAGASTLISDGDIPPRASIYDRNGNPIAYEGTMVVIWSNKNSMLSEADCQRVLANITNRPLSDFVALFTGWASETDFVIIELEQSIYASNVDLITQNCGISYTREYASRVYYGGSAMTHVVGYIGQMTQEQQKQYQPLGFRGDELVGQMGIEAQYQTQLAGQPQRVLRIREPGGITLRTLGGSQGAAPTPVMLTIDRDLQAAAAEALYDAYSYASNNWAGGAGPGAAVVLDVNTGEILAMASYPLVDPMMFNPNTNLDLTKLLPQLNSDPREPLKNHALQEQFAPGSTYKVITAVAALNENIVQPDENFFCDLTWNGVQRYQDEVPVREDWRVVWDFPPAGNVTPPMAIMASCNPFFWEYGAKLYRERGRKLVEYSRMMGLGQAYNIFGGRLNEAPGNLDDPQRPAVAINDAIGQGDVQLPPIQMAVATAGIASGSAVYKPYLVKQVGGMDGTAVISTGQPTVLTQLALQPDVLPTVREGMCGVVTNPDLGTAWYVFNDADTMPTYTVCGKTGTAQTASRANSWFIAFAPAENPEIAVVVAVKHAGREGSEVAAPIARRILDIYFGSPIASYPEWWEDPFEPLPVPKGAGVTQE
jgi:penicillin-binding protein 2